MQRKPSSPTRGRQISTNLATATAVAAPGPDDYKSTTSRKWAYPHRHTNHEDPSFPHHNRGQPRSRPRQRSLCLFWCAMCFLSFCSALFVVGIVNALMLFHFGHEEDVTNETYIRRQMQRQKQRQHRHQLDSLSLEDKSRTMPRQGKSWNNPHEEPSNDKLSEEAAFGVQDEKGQGTIADSAPDNRPRPNDPALGNKYSNMVQARRDDRNERRKEYNQRRQEEMKRQRLRRPKGVSRTVGGIFYNPNQAPSPQSFWVRWFGWNWATTNDSGKSVFDSEDIPVQDFRAHYQALIRGWQRDGVFWNYSLPATVDPIYTLSSPKAPQQQDSKLIVIVLSTRHNTQRRQVIRETWGKDHAVYFIVGGRPSLPTTNNNNNNISSIITESDAKVLEEMELLVQKETKQYNDILDTIHPESYRSLPYKLRFAYEWVSREIPDAEWILKVDDDMVARIGTLDEAILKKLNPQQPFVIGKIIPDAKVSRVGKWAEYQYTERYYPFWPKGSHGHVVSRPVAQYIAGMSNVTYYQGEDTSLGIWLSQSSLRVNWISSPYFQNDGHCEEDEFIVIGHQLSEAHMQECFDKMDEWRGDHLEDKQRNYWYVETRAQRKQMSDAAEGRRWKWMSDAGE